MITSAAFLAAIITVQEFVNLTLPVECHESDSDAWIDSPRCVQQ